MKCPVMRAQGWRVAVVAIALTVLASALLSGALLAPAASAEADRSRVAAAPQLSIAVDDAHTSVSVGDRLDYVIKVRNLGSARVSGLLIDQTLPQGMEFRSTTPRARVSGVVAIWTLNLKVGQTATIRASSRVPPTAKQLLRLATVVCARTDSAGAPIVCASHSDQLPAGAEAHAAAAAAAGTQPGAVGLSWQRPALVAALVLLALVVIGWLVVRGRRRRRRVAVVAGTPAESVGSRRMRP